MIHPDSAISELLGSPVATSHAVGGGCIHHARRLELEDGRLVFVKTADRETARLLDAEARGLELLSPHIRVPGILGWGNGWLALEWLDLHPLDASGWKSLGRQLANQHSVHGDTHGLDHDNFIGSTPQSNRRTESWREFFLDRRLRPQFHLARVNGNHLDDHKILAAAKSILGNHEPAPSLLHGDLWCGNVAALRDGSAVVFDPAPYFGDPETDLAMLERFGGPLPDAFLTVYGPISRDRGYRRPVYDLYHALNHLNLFGSTYLSMVQRCLGQMGI